MYFEKGGEFLTPLASRRASRFPAAAQEELGSGVKRISASAGCRIQLRTQDTFCARLQWEKAGYCVFIFYGVCVCGVYLPSCGSMCSRTIHSPIESLVRKGPLAAALALITRGLEPIQTKLGAMWPERERMTMAILSKQMHI